MGRSFSEAEIKRGFRFHTEDYDNPYECVRCQRRFGSEGAWKLHKPCGSAYGKGNNKRWGKDNNEGSCKECGGELRFLNENNPQEKSAMAHGYNMVCKKCKEVYK